MARTIEITVPADKVGSNLSGFPLFIDLSDLGADFWDYVTEDGHDIRTKNTIGTDLPFDLIYFVKDEQIGALRVKTNLSSSSDNTVVLHYGDTSLPWVLPTDSNGRHAVYTGFHRVIAFLDSLYDRTGSGKKVEYDAGYLPLLQEAALTTDTGCHQGMIFDYANNAFIAIGTNLLKRYEYSGGSWNLVATNSDPCGDAGTVNHCGSGFLKDGKIYIPQTVGYTTSKLSEYDSENLGFIRTRLLLNGSGNPADYTASCCWVPALDRIVFGPYSGDGSVLYQHIDDDDLTYDGTIALGTAVTQIQGIAWWRGAFWMSCDADNYLYRSELDGSEVNRAYYMSSYTYIEGVSPGGNALYIIGSNSDGHGIPLRLSPWTKYGAAHGLYVPHLGTTKMRLDADRYAQWSMGITARISERSLTNTQIFASYGKANDSDTSKRESIGWGSVKDQMGLWNSGDLWLYRNPLTDSEYFGLAFCSNFSEDTTGAAPAGWTEIWNPTRGAVTVENEGVYGRNCLRYIRTTSGYAYALSLDSPASVTDGEILAIVENQSDQDHSCRVYFRGSGAAGSNCYFAYLQPIGNTVGVQKYVSSTSTNVGTVAKTIDYGVQYYVRVRFVGSSIKVKVWEVGSAEPAGWDLDLTDAALSSGWVGIGAFTQSTGYYVYWDYFALSTATAPAVPATVPLCKDDLAITNQICGVHNETISRSLFHNGVAYTDTGCEERPSADADAVYISTPYESSQSIFGTLEWFFLTNSLLDGDWLAADYSNIFNHENFYEIGEGEAEPDLSCAIAESLQPVQDAVAFELQPYIEKSLADEAKIFTDAISAILAESLVALVGDELQIILDQPSIERMPAFQGLCNDQLPTIIEAISYGLINLTKPQRWVAPLTVTPISGLIDPLHLAAHPVRHPTMYFEPRVKSYGSFTRAISAPAEFFKTGDVTLSIADPDNTLRRRISAKTIRKATVDMRLGPEGGSFASFLRPWKRRVFNVSQPSDGLLSFTLKDNVFDFLEKTILGLVTEDNFPNMPEGAGSEFVPSIVGIVSAEKGAIKVPLVDTVNHRYAVCRNPILSVDAVYRRAAGDDDFGLVSSSEYTLRQDIYIDHGEGSGDYCALLEFSADQGNAEIRINAHGIKLTTGALGYTNFADMLLGIFEYLAWANNRGEVLNLASFDATRIACADLLCAGAITQSMTWGELVSRIQRSSNIDVFADKNDRIAIHYTGDDESPAIDLDHVLSLYGGSVSQQMADPVYNRFRYKYAPNFAAGSWTETQYDNEEDQADVAGEVMEDPQELQLYWVRDAATADAVVRGRAQYCRLESFWFEGRMPMIPVLESLELGDLVRITHLGGLEAGGYVNKQFKILKLVMDVDRLSYQFEGIVRKLPPPAYNVTTPTGGGGGGSTDPSVPRIGIYDEQNDALLMPAVNCRPGPFSNGVEGEFFVIFKNGGISKPQGQRKLLCFYTNNYGVTWQRIDQPHEPVAPYTIHTFDCCVDANAGDGIIHIAFANDLNTSILNYITFDMNTKTWGAKTPVTEITNIYQTACVSIECRYPGGEPVIFYNGQKRAGIEHPTVEYRHCYYAIKLGSTWLADQRVSPDGLYQQYTYWGESILGEANFYVQRMLAGRDNRMHFFFLGSMWFRQYAVTMNGARTMNYPPRWYRQNKQCGHIDVTEGWASADHKTLLLLKRYGQEKFVDSFSDASRVVFNQSENVSNGMVYTGDFTAKMNGFFGENTSYQLCSQMRTFGDYARHKESSSGFDWSEGLKAGPEYTYPTNIYRVFGNYFTIGGKSYIAQLTGPAGDFPTFRWIRVNSLPYMGA